MPLHPLFARTLAAATVVLLLIGCGDETDTAATTTGGGAGGKGGNGGNGGAVNAPRRVDVTASLSSEGISDPVSFTVPDGTRSITVMVSGEVGSLYALASFTTPDGMERVVLGPGAPGAAMRAAYDDEQIGQMPGDLYQSIRRGTFTLVYPYAPGQPLTAGEAELRVASDATAGAVDVTILMPEDDGAATLHVNVIAASETVSLSQPPSFLAAAQTIFDAAAIQIVVDETVDAPGTGFSVITDFSEPQEIPTSQSAQLAQLGSSLVSSTALNVFVVDALPSGVGGLSLGTPGPPLSDSYYYGVVLRATSNDAALGRVFAHEVAHFLALSHVDNRGISGMTYNDPLDDTVAGVDNLMESGTTLTPGQAFALSRSALLESN
jgi:hypothetical protein